MDILTVYLALSVMTGILSGMIKQDEKRKRTVCIINGVLLFAIAALRNKSVGYDSGQYARTFTALQGLTYEEVWTVYTTEGLFYSLCKLLGTISTSYTILYIFISGIYAASISRFIYRFSEMPTLSYFILVTVGFYGFTMTGLRQAIAISVILFGMGFFVDGSKLKFLAAVLIAFLLHNTSIVMLVLLFTPQKRHAKLSLCLLGVYCLTVVLLFHQTIFTFVSSFLGKYESYPTGAGEAGIPMMAIMYLAILSICYFGVSDPDITCCCILFPGICAELFVMNQPNMFRIAMYFEMISIAMLPNTISRMRNRQLAAGACYVVLMVFFYAFAYYDNGVIPYFFFWQNP